jgi:adenylyltransferase/sulfurtransferase
MMSVNEQDENRCKGDEDTVPSIEPVELQRELKGRNPPFLLDVREPDECSAGMIDGAVNIPLGDLGLRLDELPRDRSIVTYCHSGMRSARAAEFLASKGYGDVTNLRGGVKAWAAEVDPSFAVG